MSKIQDVTFTITGEQKIHCAACEQQIGTALSHVPGIRDVHASAKTQQVVVALDPTDVAPDEVRSKLEQMGYQTTPEQEKPRQVTPRQAGTPTNPSN